MCPMSAILYSTTVGWGWGVGVGGREWEREEGDINKDSSFHVQVARQQ